MDTEEKPPKLIKVIARIANERMVEIEKLKNMVDRLSLENERLRKVIVRYNLKIE